MKAANVGKILGAFGLLLLLSSPFTLFITTGLAWVALVKALAGVLLIVAWLVTNGNQLGQFAGKRSTFFITSTVLTALVVLVGLVAVNYIAAKKNASWDLTDKQIHSLSPQTRTTLLELTEPVKVIAFLPATDPAYEIFDSLFRRYQEVAPEKFQYTFKDPQKSPDLAEKYKLREGQTPIVLVRGEGPAETHTTLSIASEQDFVHPEQPLTNALLKLDAVGEQKVYFIVGHGELPLAPPMVPGGAIQETANLGDLREHLIREGYTPETLNLAGKTEVPRDAALVVISAARSAFSAPELAAVEKYLEEGGRLLYFAEYGDSPGLDPLLAKYAIQVDNGVVADSRFAVNSPYLVLSAFYGEHELAQPLADGELTLQWPTARSLTVLREGMLDGVKALPVVLTSPYAWLETTPNDKPEPSPGEKTGTMPLAVVSTRNTSTAENKRHDEARVVALGDSELLSRESLASEGNRNLVLNAFAWTSNQISRVTIRPPDRDISTLDMTPAMLSNIRFVTTDLLPMTLLGVGLAIWLSRRNK